MNPISNLNHFPSIEQMASQVKQTDKSNTTQIPGTFQGMGFDEILKKAEGQSEKSSVTFSKHANERLKSRDINLTEEQLKRLDEGADIAEQKGIKESLVMIDEYAFILNVKNKTVITAVENDEKKVFTNIDGAVII